LSILARHRRSYLILGSGLFAVVILILALTWPHPPSSSGVHPGPVRNAQPKVNVTYSNSTSSTIGLAQPAAGNSFLVVHLTVQNDGYQNFTTNPLRDMYVMVDGQPHNVSAPAYLFLSNPFSSLDLKNTQSATGDVVFEVPRGLTSFTPQWRAPSTIQLDWVRG